MNDLSQEFKSEISRLFKEKNFSQLQFKLEELGDIEELPINIAYIYAISKALNPSSQESDYKQSFKLLIKIYKNNKSNLEPLYNLIAVSLKSKQYNEMLDLLTEAFKIDSSNSNIIEGIAKLNYTLGNLEESHKYYELLFKLNPDRVLSRQVYLTCLNYLPDISQQYYLNKCKEYTQLLEKDVNFNQKFIITKKPKIHLGFFSSDLRKHSVSFFLKNFVKNTNKSEFVISAFSNLDIKNYDEMTKELKSYFDHWHDVKNLKDSDIIDLIKKNNIDILIDLNGHTEGNRINIFAQRSAPIQVLWLGYCNSTGLKNMDYIITDSNCIKEDEEKLYTEKIIYLPKIWNAKSKPLELPNIEELPSIKNKVFSFGSFNNFLKISDQTIKVWAKILIESNSRIILKNSVNDNEEITQNLKTKFLNHKVQENKLIFLKFENNIKNHLSLYNKIDLALDPFPYGGVTTTFEASCMGVPVLTHKGFNFNSRCGESINLNLNLSEFIAENDEDYISKAKNFLKEIDFLKKLRFELRDKALRSPLYDEKEFALSFYKNLKKIWEDCLKKNH